jgi:hypothetical protein
MEPVAQMNEDKELLPWHEPVVQKLEVTLDTRFVSGSVTDGLDGSGPG